MNLLRAHKQQFSNFRIYSLKTCQQKDNTMKMLGMDALLTTWKHVGGRQGVKDRDDWM